MIICVTAEDISLSSPVGEKFGRCRYLHFVDSKTMQVTTRENGKHDGESGVGIQVAQVILDAGTEAVITGNIGPNASDVLEAANIPVYSAGDRTIEVAVKALERQRLDLIGKQ